MKRSIFALGLVLALSLIGLFSIRTHSQSNQNNVKKTEPSKRVYDIYGKRVRANEKYVADRTLKNGRIVAYRQNKREIAALVKALKEDGMTDEQVLNPKFWTTLKCLKYNYSCLTLSGCGSICKEESKILDRQNVTLLYCYCP